MSNKRHLFSALSCTNWRSKHGEFDGTSWISTSTRKYHGLNSKPLDKGPPGQKLQLLGQGRLLNLRATCQALPLYLFA